MSSDPPGFPGAGFSGLRGPRNLSSTPKQAGAAKAPSAAPLNSHLQPTSAPAMGVRQFGSASVTIPGASNFAQASASGVAPVAVQPFRMSLSGATATPGGASSSSGAPGIPPSKAVGIGGGPGASIAAYGNAPPGVVSSASHRRGVNGGVGFGTTLPGGGGGFGNAAPGLNNTLTHGDPPRPVPPAAGGAFVRTSTVNGDNGVGIPGDLRKPAAGVTFAFADQRVSSATAASTHNSLGFGSLYGLKITSMSSRALEGNSLTGCNNSVQCATSSCGAEVVGRGGWAGAGVGVGAGGREKEREVGGGGVGEESGWRDATS